MSSSDEGEKFEVEKIVNHKVGRDGKKSFWIRWKGYGPSDDTWEKEANLHCEEKLKEYWDGVKEKEEKKRSSTTDKKQKSKKRRNISSSEDVPPTVNMEGVFDTAPSTPPRPIDEEAEVAVPPPKKKSKPNEKEQSPIRSKEKHKKKSKRDRSKSRDPDEPSTSSSKSKKKDKKKKKNKHRDHDEGGGGESSSKRSHEKDSSSGATKNKEKTAFISPNNGAKVPPLILILSDDTSGNSKSASPSDKENIISETLIKTEPVVKDVQSSKSEASVTVETSSSTLTSPPSTSLPLLANRAINDVTEQTTDVCDNAALNEQIHPFTPEFIEENGSPDSRPPVLSPMPPFQHKCFENSPSVSEFAKKAKIHNINHHQIMYVLSKIWKARCPECTENHSVTDDSVEYAFALLQFETKNYFLIKIKNCLNELFLIEADTLREACPRIYANFVSDTRKYFDGLGDLGMAIEDQQNTVASHHENNGILHHFNNNSEATFQNTSISYDSEKVRQATRDIVTLFILELQFAIGEFMAKTVDSNDLEKFAMYYYHKRKQMYTAVKEETVEQNYEHLYISLIPKPSSNS